MKLWRNTNTKNTFNFDKKLIIRQKTIKNSARKIKHLLATVIHRITIFLYYGKKN